MNTVLILINLMTLLSRNALYFLKFFELGSFTAAAESLRIGQPALSLAMAQFEQEMGAALFEKRGRNRVLTKAGLSLARSLAKAERGLANVEKSVVSGRDNTALRFGVVTHWAEKCILPSWGECETIFGQIQAHFGYSRSIFEQVKAGVLDFGIITWLGTPKFKNRKFLREDPCAVVGLKGKFNHIRNAESAEDLKAEPWIWHRKPQNNLDHYAGRFEKSLLVDNYSLLKHFLLQGWGIADVQLEAFTKLELSKLVVARSFYSLPIGVYVVWCDDLNQRQLELKNWVVERITKVK